MAKILSKLSGKISDECLSKKCYSSHVIEVSDVIDSMEKLEARKSDAFINGCHSLFIHISLLFSALLRHGVTPNNMLLATLVPIPSNYRAIALRSIFSKIFDIIIMEKHSSIFTSSELQFGFKAKHPTSQFSFVGEEVIDFYNRNDSPVYLVTLDAPLERLTM